MENESNEYTLDHLSRAYEEVLKIDDMTPNDLREKAEHYFTLLGVAYDNFDTWSQECGGHEELIPMLDELSGTASTIIYSLLGLKSHWTKGSDLEFTCSEVDIDSEKELIEYMSEIREKWDKYFIQHISKTETLNEHGSLDESFELSNGCPVPPSETFMTLIEYNQDQLNTEIKAAHLDDPNNRMFG